MGEENPLLRIIGGTSRKPALFVGLVAAFLAAMAGNAGATVQIQNQNDPAGDPTVVGYTLTPPPGQGAPVNFSLHDGEYRGFGPFSGQVVVQAVLPAGWRVEHIQCHGFNPTVPSSPTANAFTIDEANGRVTMQHAVDDEQFCTFTNGRASSGGGSSGVSPAPPPNIAPSLIPSKTALLGVKAKRGYAVATVRIIRRSVIKSVLSRRGKTIGSSRVVRNAGTYDVTVSIKPSIRRALKKQGLKRVSTQLKVVVAGTTVKTTRVFRFRVLVPV
jgi:hypothetical protein